MNDHRPPMDDDQGNPESKDTTQAEAGSSNNASCARQVSDSSVDSVYEHLSCWDGYKFEMNDSEIKDKLRGVDRGSIQVTLRKCSYTLGFEPAPLDQSRESLTDDVIDKGYSNKYGSRAHQQGAWEDCEIHDDVSVQLWVV